jgi:hypothetical protein
MNYRQSQSRQAVSTFNGDAAGQTYTDPLVLLPLLWQRLCLEDEVRKYQCC